MMKRLFHLQPENEGGGVRMYEAHTFYCNFFITLIDCEDLYIYVGESTYDFKLIRLV